MTLWETNLAALSARPDTPSRRLTAALSERGPQPAPAARSRQGLPVPVVGTPPRSLVSLFDAAKEAERWAASASGTVAVWGGAGREARRSLGERATLMFWIEPRLEVWRSLFTWEDWSDLMGPEWQPCRDAAEWGQSLLELYHPVWDGTFRTLEWRAAVQGEELLWEAHRRVARECLERRAADSSTQARFGERWYRNTLVNLRRLRPGSAPACEGLRVVVAGAGPTLEDELDKRENRSWLDRRAVTGDRLFAADTAYPALLARGVVPDLVLCLDGQLASGQHFVGKPAVPVAADLAAHPVLSRVGAPVLRYLSGHPFSALVARFFPEMPVLDGSEGNVSGLARQAAWAWGASKVETWGVDFAYRDGQAYAGGTYVEVQAARGVNRLSPWETRLGSAYGAAGRERTNAAGHMVDTTPLLRHYRALWTTAARPSRTSREHGDATAWPAFAAWWKQALTRLPLPRGSLSVFVRTLENDTRQQWWALWPLAQSLWRQGVTENLPRATVERALSFLED